MKFTETAIAGVWLIDLEPLTDERGFFARTFCADEFAAHGLDPTVAQCNVSLTSEAGSIRGLHYQVAPAAETKLVRVVRGANHDVAVDLRPCSTTYRRHVAVELSAENRRAMYVPADFAHGFQTLVADTEVEYQMGAPYTPGTDRGLRYDDPALAIPWPRPVTTISQKDRTWPLLTR
ncbi:MAG: rmlC [Actinomycetia bacterium]|nr:rmlC [Actinomycetes bacterium]